MRTNVEINLKPFSVPNFVLEDEKVEPTFEHNGIPLKKIDAKTLEKLCEAFTDAVFRKAGKRRPPQKRHAQQEKDQ